MNETQTEIKAIKAELQAIQAHSHPLHRSPSAPPPSPQDTEIAEFAPPSNPFPPLNPATPARPARAASQPIAPLLNVPPAEPTSAQERWQSRDASLSSSMQRLRQLQTPPIPSASEQQLQASLRLLEAQAKHINHLSRTQEAAIRELQTIAQQVEREWQAVEQVQNDWAGQPITPSPGPLWSACEYQAITLPHVAERDQGGFQLGTRAIDLTQAYRDAAETAQTLRQRQEQTQTTPRPRKRSRPFWAKYLQQWLPSHAEPATTLKASTPSDPFTLQETLTLLVGAALTRILLDLLLQAFPLLWLPTMLLLIAPALFAAYRSTTQPQTGIVWGYRLCMIMLGLLIGGRLG
ncbi:MAG TPA: hypothetical protein V6D10_20510 [Trichocoleus sp.]|jgi:hypothetical protein